MAPLFRVAVLTSSNAPGVDALRDDPNRGLIYELADVVTRRFGDGPLMLVGPPYPVSGIATDAIRRGDYDVAVEYARVHRDWMMRTAYGELLVRAMQFLAAGTLKVSNDIVWIDGAPGP